MIQTTTYFVLFSRILHFRRDDNQTLSSGHIVSWISSTHGRFDVTQLQTQNQVLWLSWHRCRQDWNERLTETFYDTVTRINDTRNIQQHSIQTSPGYRV